MATISISQKIKEKLPELVLGVIETDVVMEAKHLKLTEEMNRIPQTLRMEISAVSSHPVISASRKAYKVLGKDPARYRLSAEALMRRVLKGLDLPQVNNIVDLINLISIQTGMSIGGYNADEIKGDILMDIGLSTDEYDAIGRGIFNIENLPVLRDQFSAFGSPTSDSERTSVTLNTKRFLMVIFGFSGEGDTIKTLDLAVKLLNKFAKASHTNTLIVK